MLIIGVNREARRKIKAKTSYEFDLMPRFMYHAQQWKKVKRIFEYINSTEYINFLISIWKKKEDGETFLSSASQLPVVILFRENPECVLNCSKENNSVSVAWV